MKSYKTLIAAAMVACCAGSTLTSCNNDDPYRAGFIFQQPQYSVTPLYANTTGDSLIMQCFGPWRITAEGDDQSWATIDQMTGKGSAIYSFGVHFAQNTTGQSRTAKFIIRDTDHPDEAYASWRYLQFATRGDGSLGNASLVRTITASDGYKATIDYDEKARPVKFLLTDANSAVAEQIDIDYNELSGRLTVSRAGIAMSGTMDLGFQAERLTGASDTVGYYAQYYSNGMPMPLNNAFSFVSSTSKGMQASSYLLNGQSLDPDSLHTADSLRYVRQWRNDSFRYVEQFKIEYASGSDNRHQSIDPNQLLLGFAECQPLQLLSMFRYCRSTSIIARAISSKGNIDVTTELNPDRSISRMVVSDRRNDTETSYVFGY